MRSPGNLCAVLLSLTAIAGCSGAGRTDVDQSAVAVVARATSRSRLTGKNLPVSATDLRTKPNARGQGTFVYHPRTRFSGVERHLLWLVLDNRAYALNGATKDVTPSLPWPREAEEAVWRRTGLDKYSATEAIRLVFTEGPK